jgi:hypothetical protein
MFTPSQVPNWMIVIYERPQRFNDQTAHQMANELVKACETVGTTTYAGSVDHHAHLSDRYNHQPSAGAHKMGVGARNNRSGLSPHH